MSAQKNTQRLSLAALCCVAVTAGTLSPASALIGSGAKPASGQGVSSAIAKVYTFSPSQDENKDSPDKSNDSQGDTKDNNKDSDSSDNKDSNSSGNNDSSGDTSSDNKDSSSDDGSQSDNNSSSSDDGSQSDDEMPSEAAKKSRAQFHATGDDSNLVNASVCTGTMVSKQWMITASHCVDKKASLSSVSFGNGDTPIDVDSVINHPKHDVALLHLTNAAPASPVKIYSGKELTQSTTGDVFGWGGESKGKQGKSAEKLTTAQAKIGGKISRDAGLIKGMPTQKAKILNGARSARGDSGGPFIVNNNVYGILSQGIVDASGDATSTTTALFVPLSSYGQWINDSTKEDIVNKDNNSPQSSSQPSSRTTGNNGAQQPFAHPDNSAKGHGNNAGRGAQGARSGGGHSSAHAFAKGENPRATAHATPNHASSHAQAGGDTHDKSFWDKVKDKVKHAHASA